jgi:DNA modification methylase
MKLILGDSLEVLKEFENNSIDSIVTDAPYGLSFMGKKWDYDVPSQEIWEECLRVLKPGGYLLAFAGTRTQHRMAVRIEDAGFEIRDMIAWVYGSGFPKSLNIGKAVDKLQGNEREVVGEHPYANRGTAQSKQSVNLSGSSERSQLLDKGTSEYEGWGTALKPSLESITVAQKSIDFAPNLSPIIMSRKPISEKTVAQNVLKYGTGGINIDGCRVGMSTEDKEMLDAKSSKNPTGVKSGFGGGIASPAHSQGRFPANLIHDGSDEVVGLFPNSKGASSQNNYSNGKIYRGQSLLESESKLEGYRDWYNDNGSAARFFYCAKASKSERNKGLEGFEEKLRVRQGLAGEKKDTASTNFHPTVKPISLMRYLVRLVTPKGGTVLDPFMGSGTTGIGAKLEGFDFIGIEREAEYIKIAEARINAWEKDNKLL